jgi:hypothetical protein
MIGAGGSCRWTRSGSNASSSRRIVVNAEGKIERLETAPFALTPIVRLSGTRKSGRSRGSGAA